MCAPTEPQSGLYLPQAKPQNQTLLQEKQTLHSIRTGNTSQKLHVVIHLSRKSNGGHFSQFGTSFDILLYLRYEFIQCLRWNLKRLRFWFHLRGWDVSSTSYLSCAASNFGSTVFCPSFCPFWRTFLFKALNIATHWRLICMQRGPLKWSPTGPNWFRMNLLKGE